MGGRGIPNSGLLLWGAHLDLWLTRNPLWRKLMKPHFFEEEDGFMDIPAILAIIATIITVILGVIELTGKVKEWKIKKGKKNNQAPEKPVIEDSSDSVVDPSLLQPLIKVLTGDDQTRMQEYLALLQRDPKASSQNPNPLRRELLSFIRNAENPAKERCIAGDLLAILGDPRFRADAWNLPNEDLIGFVEIPAGKFFMGNGDTTDGRPLLPDGPQHIVNLPLYYIGRYPVTVAQYRAFLAETHSGETTQIDPGQNNRPVVNVTWLEAMRYCHWLNERLCIWPGTPKVLSDLLQSGAWTVTLPSEAEWEKAARGMADPRRYPWVFDPDPNKANYMDTGIGTTSTVGCFEGVDSPFKVHDLSGNVLEWTRSNWGKDVGKPEFGYPYLRNDPREDINAPGSILRVIRGGSFYSGPKDISCFHRSAEKPNARHDHIGFRLVITRHETN